MEGQTGQATAAGVEAGVDYWEFTVPYEKGWDVLTSFPGGRELRRNKRGDVLGWRGYTHSAYVAQGKGMVGWSPDDQRMGVHFSLGGEALRVMAALDPWWQDLPSVMGAVLVELDGHTTRVDICWDDQTGVLDMATIAEARRTGSYVSRWKNSRYIDSTEHTKAFGPVRGESFYFGSGKSDSQLRIYDKRAERMQKEHAVEVDHWIRVELQCRRKRADAVARLYASVKQDAQAVMVKLAGVLRGMVEFKVPDPFQSRKTRWEPAGWWARFLGYAEKARLATVEPEARTVEHVKAWVSNQVAPSLALLQEALGFERAWAFLYAEAQEGRARMGPRHKAILAVSGV